MTSTSTTDMQAMENPSIVLYGAKNARLEDRPVPEILEPHDVLVRIHYVGVCGSDVHFWNHGGIGQAVVNPVTGITMGHEASGTIHATGSRVTSVKPGDRVAIEPGTPCRLCKTCKSGTYNLCRKMRFAAAPGRAIPSGGEEKEEHECTQDTQGTLAKFFRVAEDCVYRIPDTLGLDEAVLVEPLAVAVHAVKLGKVRAGDTVVVMGSGTIGLLCGAVARQFGAHRIVLVDVVQRKLDFAAHYLTGCETHLARITLSAEQNAANILAALAIPRHATHSSPASSASHIDTVLEASGATSSIATGLHILRPGGTFVQAGLGAANVEIPMVALSQKELTVRGCFRYGPGDFDLAIGFLNRGCVSVRELITSVTPFENATLAWDRTLIGDGIKNLIKGVL